MPLPRVSVVGAGQVGATTAQLLVLKQLADVTLIDIVEGLAKGKALDLAQAAPIEGFSARIHGTTDYDAMADSHLVIITAGLSRKPGMSRDDLLAANANIVGPIGERIARVAPHAIVIVVTNPLDVMVALTLQRTGFSRHRVIGMAGVLDSARLRAFIAEQVHAPASRVEAMVLGSHGDLMIALRGSLTVEGKPLAQRLAAEDIDRLIERAKNGGAEVVSLLKTGSAFYAPASGVVAMAHAILNDTKAVLPCCAALEGEYGLRDVCIGVPVALGARGVERVVELSLTEAERQALAAAARQVEELTSKLAALPPAA